MRYIANKNQRIDADLFFKDMEESSQSFIQDKNFVTISPVCTRPCTAEEAIHNGNVDTVMKRFRFTISSTCHNSETENIDITSYDNLIKLRDAINDVAAAYDKHIGELVDCMTTVKEQATA